MHFQATRNTDTCASSVVGLYNKVVFTTLSIIKIRNTNRKNRLDCRLHNTLVTRIEEAVKPANIKIIQNPKESITLAYDIVKSAKNEVLKIFPSIKAFRRQTRIGIMHLFKDAVERGVKVRILIPADEQQIIQISNEVSLALPQIDIRSID